MLNLEPEHSSAEIQFSHNLSTLKWKVKTILFGRVFSGRDSFLADGHSRKSIEQIVLLCCNL